MPLHIIKLPVDLEKYPAITPSTHRADLTLGDLHANAIKLLFLLIKEGFCKLPASAYLRLVELYALPQSTFTREQLNEFKTLIDSIEVVNTHTVLRLLGDELADRGQNDYFTLYILSKVKQQNLRFEILLSNHGVAFLRSYQFYPTTFTWSHSGLQGSHMRSLSNLLFMVQRGWIEPQEVVEHITYTYQPALKILSYSLVNNEITLYSHAPINITTIKQLAQRFDCLYGDKTPFALVSTIDAINTAFQHHFLNNKPIDQLFFFDILDAFYNPNLQQLAKEKRNISLEFTLWNRDSTIKRPSKHQGYKVIFVHGHHHYDVQSRHIHNLDNNLGKLFYSYPENIPNFNNQDIYHCVSTHATLPRQINKPPMPTPFQLKCLIGLAQALLVAMCISLIVMSALTANPLFIAVAAGSALGAVAIWKISSPSSCSFFSSPLPPEKASECAAVITKPEESSTAVK